MKYRARLIDPEMHLEKPLQTLCNSYDEVQRWALHVLKKARSPLAVVNVYMTEEKQIAIIPKSSIEGGDCVSHSQVPSGASSGLGKDAGPGLSIEKSQTEGEA